MTRAQMNAMRWSPMSFRANGITNWHLDEIDKAISIVFVIVVAWFVDFV